MDPCRELSAAERWEAVAAHRERLVRLARRRVPSAIDAEDCAHEAMLRVVAMPDVDPDRLAALLTSVTVRLCVDWHRRARAATTAIAAYSGRRSVEADPLDDLADIAEARWLSGQLGTLAPTEREVLLGRAAGRSMSDLATHLGLSYKAVEGAFGRARRKLRAAVAHAGLLLWPFRPGTARRAQAVVAVPAVTAVVLLTWAPAGRQDLTPVPGLRLPVAPVETWEAAATVPAAEPRPPTPRLPAPAPTLTASPHRNGGGGEGTVDCDLRSTECDVGGCAGGDVACQVDTLVTAVPARVQQCADNGIDVTPDGSATCRAEPPSSPRGA